MPCIHTDVHVRGHSDVEVVPVAIAIDIGHSAQLCTYRVHAPNVAVVPIGHSRNCKLTCT